MDKIVLKAENISKQYRLGQLGTGTVSHDLNRWWHKMRGKEDPYLKVGDVNDRSRSGGSEYVWSLKDINFEVKQGDVLGIIGKNGAGKSTLLKILSQVTTPTTGEVKIKGRVASLLEVGTGFHPELSGRENIYLNGAILGMSKAEIKSKLEEIVDFSGVAKYLDTPVKRYSSGMMVRLGFAVAAHLEPEILIVDEVLAVGDQEFQDKCIGKMKDVSGQGRTVLFVSHNMGAIKSLCKTGLLLQHGKIHDHNTIENVINSYNKISVPNENHLGIEYRMERKGSGAIKLIDLNIGSLHSEKTEVVGAGDLCKIKLTLQAFEKQTPPSFYVALIVRKNTGERMFTISTDFHRRKIATRDQNIVTFEIAKMPLSIGKYFIDVFVWDDGEVIDEIESVMEFSVIENDFYKFGVKQGPFIDTFFTEFKITE